MIFVYDGTYPGFLTAVYDIYYYGTSCLESIRPAGGETALFGEEKTVETNFIKAEKVISAFEKRCGRQAVRLVYRAFLSDEAGMEMKIFEFLRQGFRQGRKLYIFSKEDWYRDLCDMSRAVGNEAEKFRGILRFSQLQEGTLYAVIHPTHNILPVLAVHFRDRLGSLDWIIYDGNRKEAAVYGKGRTEILSVPEIRKDPAFSSEEEDFRSLWRRYYRHMGIEERNNPDCRRNYLPKKYWADLVEMEDPFNRSDIRMEGIGQEKPASGKTEIVPLSVRKIRKGK